MTIPPKVFTIQKPAISRLTMVVEVESTFTSAVGDIVNTTIERDLWMKVIPQRIHVPFEFVFNNVSSAYM